MIAFLKLSRLIVSHMKHSFIVLLVLLSLTANAQDYKSQIDAHRKQYKNEFLSDQHSPLKQADLPNLHFYDADSAYHVTAVVEMLSNEATFQMQTFDGAKQTYIKYAYVKFVVKGAECKLYIYKNISFNNVPALVNYLFLPFTDKTNGTETYGGGRYIDLRTTDIKNGLVEIDFNKAYNPYCAYSTGYQCPMPPPENNLDLKIQAGEKQYTGEKKH
jgi:uncharacterized protein (DUF1684 family)